MRIAWLQPWLGRRQTTRTPSLTAGAGRWPFTRWSRRRKSCKLSEPNAPGPALEAISSKRVALPLRHHLDVNLVTAYLQHELDCDGWHVACRHDHQLVVQLTRGGMARYCVSYDCSPAVEKAVCHGSRAWAVAVTPLHGEDNLAAERVMEIKAGLDKLHA